MKFETPKFDKITSTIKKTAKLASVATISVIPLTESNCQENSTLETNNSHKIESQKINKSLSENDKHTISFEKAQKNIKENDLMHNIKEVTIIGHSPECSFVKDANDPFYKAYCDSLALNTKTKKFIDSKEKLKELWSEFYNSSRMKKFMELVAARDEKERKGEDASKEGDAVSKYWEEYLNPYEEIIEKMTDPSQQYIWKNSIGYEEFKDKRKIRPITDSRKFIPIDSVDFKPSYYEKDISDNAKEIKNASIKPIGFELMTGNSDGQTWAPIYEKPKHRVFIEGTPEAENAKKQIKIKRAGLYDGEIDGDWGPKSEKAWNKFKEIPVEVEKSAIPDIQVNEPVIQEQLSDISKIDLTDAIISREFGKYWKSSSGKEAPPEGTYYYYIKTKDGKEFIFTESEYSKLKK